MKTLKISLVATIAAMLAWWLGVAQRIWPAHPQFAVFLLALVICLILQFTWSEPTDKNS
jgi:ABC-type Fe3+-siderophore transport system permease subunit